MGWSLRRTLKACRGLMLATCQFLPIKFCPSLVIPVKTGNQGHIQGLANGKVVKPAM